MKRKGERESVKHIQEAFFFFFLFFFFSLSFFFFKFLIFNFFLLKKNYSVYVFFIQCRHSFSVITGKKKYFMKALLG